MSTKIWGLSTLPVVTVIFYCSFSMYINISIGRLMHIASRRSTKFSCCELSFSLDSNLLDVIDTTATYRVIALEFSTHSVEFWASITNTCTGKISPKEVLENVKWMKRRYWVEQWTVIFTAVMEVLHTLKNRSPHSHMSLQDGIYVHKNLFWTPLYPNSDGHKYIYFFACLASHW